MGKQTKKTQLKIVEFYTVRGLIDVNTKVITNSFQKC